ncbi:MAG: PRC-barrel domain-containing protein [Planctomycetota bacterium]
MKNLQKLEFYTVVTVILSLFVFTALAGEEKKIGQEMEKFTPSLQKCNTLIGVALKNIKGDTLGTVDEFILDSPVDYCCQEGMESKAGKEMKTTGMDEKERGMPMELGDNRIAYIVITPDKSIKTMHERLLIPWDIVQVQFMSKEKGEKPYFVLRKEKVALNDAPGFNGDKWPEHFGRDWKDKVNPFFGVQEKEYLKKMSISKSMRKMADENVSTKWIRHQRVTKLMGSNVKEEKGESLGKLKDVFIDTRDGVLVYAAIEHGGFLGMGENLAAIPWTALGLQGDEKSLIASVTKSNFENLAMGEKEFSLLNDMTQARRLYDRFQRQPYWETYSYIGSKEMEKMKKAEPEKIESKSSQKGGV